MKVGERMKKHEKVRKQTAFDKELHDDLILVILRRCNAIRQIYRERYPEAKYLSITITEDRIFVNNEYWGADSEYPINAKGVLCCNMEIQGDET